MEPSRVLDACVEVRLIVSQASVTWETRQPFSSLAAEVIKIEHQLQLHP
jgi:hypothetical protein